MGIELAGEPRKVKTGTIGDVMTQAKQRGPLADPGDMKIHHQHLFDTIKMPGGKAFDENTVVTIGFNLILLLEDWP